MLKQLDIKTKNDIRIPFFIVSGGQKAFMLFEACNNLPLKNINLQNDRQSDRQVDLRKKLC